MSLRPAEIPWVSLSELAITGDPTHRLEGAWVTPWQRHRSLGRLKHVEARDPAPTRLSLLSRCKGCESPTLNFGFAVQSMSNKPCVFCFVYCVLQTILASWVSGRVVTKVSTECMDCSYLELCEGAAVAKHKARAISLYLAWLRPCLTHGFWLVSVYSTFLAIKAPEHVSRLLIVSGFFNSPRFIITHNHRWLLWEWKKHRQPH